MNLNKHSKVRAVGLSCSFALLALLGLAVFCPDMNDSANAAETSNATFQLDFILDRNNVQSQIISSDINQISASSTTATFLIDFFLSPKLSISVDGLATSTSTSVTPIPSGATASAQASFTAESNSVSGIGVVVYGNSTTLSNGSNTIPTIASGTKSGLAGLEPNTWGYNLTPVDASVNELSATNLVYRPMGTTAASKVSPTPGANSTSTSQKYFLTFGAKVSNATNPGEYSNTVTVHVVPSATTTAAANDIARSIKEDSAIYDLNTHNDESGEPVNDASTAEDIAIVDAE